MKSRRGLSKDVLGSGMEGELGTPKSHPWVDKSQKRTETFEPSIRRGSSHAELRNITSPAISPVCMDQAWINLQFTRKTLDPSPDTIRPTASRFGTPTVQGSPPFSVSQEWILKSSIENLGSVSHQTMINLSPISSAFPQPTTSAGVWKDALERPVERPHVLTTPSELIGIAIPSLAYRPMDKIGAEMREVGSGLVATWPSNEALICQNLTDLSKDTEMREEEENAEARRSLWLTVSTRRGWRCPKCRRSYRRRRLQACYQGRDSRSREYH